MSQTAKNAAVGVSKYPLFRVLTWGGYEADFYHLTLEPGVGGGCFECNVRIDGIDPHLLRDHCGFIKRTAHEWVKNVFDNGELFFRSLNRKRSGDFEDFSGNRLTDHLNASLPIHPIAENIQ